MLESVSKQSLSNQVLKVLLRHITAQGLGPGDRLPSERDLAQQLKIGRGPVREALKALETIGAVSRQSSRGTILQPVDFSFLAETSQYLLLRSPVDLAELFVTRRLIEVNVIPLVACTATEEQFERLDNANRLMEAEIDAGRIPTGADLEFHQALLAAANNKFLAQFGTLVQEYFHDPRHKIMVDDEETRNALNVHRQIVECLRKKQVKRAQELMKEHLGTYLRKGVIQVAALPECDDDFSPQDS